jgi:glycosyltransferase involved in cell wall biosynthesis
VTCTDLDRRYFVNQLGISRPCEVIDNGVNTKKYQPSSTYGSDYVLIIGAQSKEATANFDATWYFINEIWPLVLAARPDIKLKIVGRDPDASVKGLPQRYENIEVVGFVEDERDVLGRAAALLVPLRVGGGSRLKILTAMAMGRVVISTSIGAEGIDCTDGKDFLRADDPATFARHVVEVFSDAQYQQKIGVAARRLMEERYDWDIIGARLRAFYRNLI